MKIFIQKEYFYSSSKGADPTDYFRKQHPQCYRCIRPAQGQFQRHPSGAFGGRDACIPWLWEKPAGGS